MTYNACYGKVISVKLRSQTSACTEGERYASVAVHWPYRGTNINEGRHRRPNFVPLFILADVLSALEGDIYVCRCPIVPMVT